MLGPVGCGCLSPSRPHSSAAKAALSRHVEYLRDAVAELHPSSVGSPAPSASTHPGPIRTVHSPMISRPSEHRPTRPPPSRLLPMLGPTCIPLQQRVGAARETRALHSFCRTFPFYLTHSCPPKPAQHLFIFVLFFII